MQIIYNEYNKGIAGANELGFNFIFVEKRLAEKELPEVSIESVLTHPSGKQNYTTFITTIVNQ